MKKTAVTLIALAVLACGAGALLAQAPEDAKFKKFQDTFWDAYFKFYPTAGSIQGFAKYNDKLEDPSEASLDKFHEILDGLNQELVTKIDKTKLSADNQIEHEMLLDFLDMEFLKLQTLLPWDYNPLLYNDLFIQSMRSLLVKNGALGRHRRRGPGQAHPRAGQEGQGQSQDPAPGLHPGGHRPDPGHPRLLPDRGPQALRQAPRRSRPSSSRPSPPSKITRDSSRASCWPGRRGTSAMGEAHLRTLRRTTQGNLPIIEEVVQRSLADFNNIRREMFLVCIPFYKIMYPNVDIEQLGRTKGEEATRNIVIQGVLDKIKGDHVARDEFVNRINASVAGIKAFIQQQGLLNLPEENLAIEPMPAYCADGSWTRLMTPGAFEAGGPYTLFVHPVPTAWSAEEADVVHGGAQQLLHRLHGHPEDLPRLSSCPPISPARTPPSSSGWPPTRASSRAGRSSSRTCSSRAATATTTCGCGSTSSSSSSRPSSISRWTSTSTRAPGPRRRSSST